jgi:hypothetical protein
MKERFLSREWWGNGPIKAVVGTLLAAGLIYFIVTVIGMSSAAECAKRADERSAQNEILLDSLSTKEANHFNKFIIHEAVQDVQFGYIIQQLNRLLGQDTAKIKRNW